MAARRDSIRRLLTSLRNGTRLATEGKGSNVAMRSSFAAEKAPSAGSFAYKDSTNPTSSSSARVSSAKIDKKDRKIIFVLGGPGSGKGTQCSKLVKDFRFKHLSAGELLRELVKSGSPEGRMVEQMIQEGRIVPSEVTIRLLDQAMKKSDTPYFLVDGFPRNEENRASFEKQTGTKPEIVLYFDCPDDVMRQRLLARSDDRDDDNDVAITKRLQTFHTSTQGVINYYSNENRVHTVDATSPPDEVYARVKEIVQKTLHL